MHRILKLCGSPSDDYWKKSKLRNASVFKPLQAYNSHLAEAFKDISPAAFGLLVKLLSFDPENRGSATTALQSEASLSCKQTHSLFLSLYIYIFIFL